MMKFTNLHDRFGIEIIGIQLADLTAAQGYPEIRDLFERHSLLLFREQQLNNAQHLALAELFGPIEDRDPGTDGPQAKISPLSNVGDNEQVIDEHDLHVLQLKSNQLWHTDSTFIPRPALTNILRADVLPSSGGETEFVSTRVAWQDLPQALRRRTRERVFCHRFAHSRQKISQQLAQQPIIAKWGDQRWSALWRNPVNGKDALYIASHIFAVEGMGKDEGEALIDELVGFATQDHYVYSHHWKSGDVLIWDERATLHRGRPWPYEQARSLNSVCVTVRDCDGLRLVQPNSA
jgi:alpha-ketoglutarate-dependent 2,4-dichlorophenoxyacetate dioxygenase